jgi:hypothetical protein
MTSTRTIIVALAIAVSAIPTIARSKPRIPSRNGGRRRNPIAGPEPKKADPLPSPTSPGSPEPTHQRIAAQQKVFTGEFRGHQFHLQFNKPADDTIRVERIFRSGEIQVTQLGIGGDFHYDNVVYA